MRTLALLLLVCFSVPLIIGASYDSYAQTKQKEPGDIKYKIAGKEENCRSKHPGKLLATIVPCIKDAVVDATEQMTDEFDEYLKPGAVAFMTLVVTLFGVKMLTREGDMKKDGLMLLFKLSGVFLFMDNFGGFISATFGTIDDAIDMVTTSLGGLSGVQCPMDSYPGDKPWNYFDCILGELFGFAPGAVVGTSLIGMLGSAAWSGQFGGMLFMGGAWVLFFILRLIIRATYTYLMGIIIVGFLIIISPLIIPLLILNATFTYFEHWLRALMSTMIQPVMIMAYVTLCFSIVDKIMFDDQIGLAKKLTHKDIEQAQNEKGVSDASSISNDPVSTEKRVGNDPKWVGGKPGVNKSAPIFSASALQNFYRDTYSVEFKDERAKKSSEVFVSMIALILIAYLLNEMLDELVQLMQAVLGGGFALGSAVQQNPLEQKMDKIKKNMMGAFANGSGKGGAQGMSDFVTGIRKGITG